MDPRTLRDVITGTLYVQVEQFERSIGGLAQEAAGIEAKVKSLRVEIGRQTTHLNTIKNEIERRNRPAPEPRVSEHALLRYLERAKEINIEAARQEILTPAVIAAVQAGASGITVNGIKFVVQGATIVTTLGDQQRIKSSDAKRTQVIPDTKAALDEHFDEQREAAE